jgi:DNA-binding NarL/FixJ family response regulator
VEENVTYGRVILADRHQDMLEGIRGLLGTVFDTVLMVADINSLINTARRLEADLAVVDFSLPASDSDNIAQELKQHFPDLKLIVLSIHDEPTVLKEVLAAGAEGFVLKRSAATDLIPAVRAVIAGRTYISPTLVTQREGDRHKTLNQEKK